MKTERFELALSKADKLLITRAAKKIPQSMGSFVLAAAIGQAREVLSK